ncbi:SDR family NAD(P)-dependent oxidoreductase [Rhizomonospora bruguierae]|uniref:SDR family NAD(P)-dependent oxidoreductase n=1 Tax=Rhizomonospora bruguierae TaxID=1581705 RepID=UPI001BD1083F|nr:SDR family oxidoreductase [Micromonospora sp. NBRC 107566]
MTVVVVGGTSGLGREVAAHYVHGGREVVLTGRDAGRAEAVARELGAAGPGTARGVALDLAEPAGIPAALAKVGPVDRLVLAAIDRDHNTAADYDVTRAVHLVTLKLVGYTEVVHALLDRLAPDASILLFGGQALNRPYPGSTTVSTVNGGVVGMVHALATELGPVRVNAIHPGIVGDSPYWSGKDTALAATRARTPTGRLVTMADITGAVVFLLENGGVNGVNLAVDGGWLLT